MTEKFHPALDQKLDNEIKTKVLGMARMTGLVIISDGWTSVSHKPIINTLASLPAGSYFLEALDTEGQTKDSAFIANFINRHIMSLPEGMRAGVCMDGACVSSLSLSLTQGFHMSFVTSALLTPSTTSLRTSFPRRTLLGCAASNALSLSVGMLTCLALRSTEFGKWLNSCH
eukprot:scaffold48766_cov19-Tisochrysis_lutea.AAC.1